MQNNLFGGVHKPAKVHKIRIPFQGSKNKIAENICFFQYRTTQRVYDYRKQI